MGVSIKRVGGEDYGRYLKVMIGGDSGAGKTRFASTFPDTLYLATDPSLDSVIDRAPAYAEIKASDDMLDVLMKLRQPKSAHEKWFGFSPKTIVIDTADDLQRIYVKERLAETKKDALAIQDYGWLGTQMRDIIRNYRNLPMHVIVTSHLKDDKDEETGKITVKPQLVGAFCDELSAMFSLSFLIKTATVTKVVDGASKKVEVKLVQTSGDANHPWVKDRFGVLPRPEYESDLTTDFDRIYKAVFDRVLPAGQVLGNTGEALSAPKESSVDADAVAAQERKKATTATKKAAAAKEAATPTLPEAQPDPTPAVPPTAEAPPVASPPEPSPAPSEAPVEAPAESTPSPQEEPQEEPDPSPAPAAEPARPLTQQSAPGRATSESSVPTSGTTPEMVLAMGPDQQRVYAESLPSEEKKLLMVCISGGTQNVDGCGKAIENEDQRDLSWLRFRTTLCRTCFQAAKAK